MGIILNHILSILKRVSEMDNLMIDLETLGTGPNSVFVSVGAVFFEPSTGELGKKLYHNVDWQSSLDAGRVMDADTVKWWLSQSDSARKAILRDGVTLAESLSRIQVFIKSYSTVKHVKVWANGSVFDITMLENAFAQVNLTVPWIFWNVRDVRTIRDLGKSKVNKKIFELSSEQAHNALADAEHQANYVSKLYQAIKGL